MALTLASSGQGGVFTLRGNTFAGSFNVSTTSFQFDADALAFFSRVTAAGGTLTATEQSAILTLVASLKSASIWTAMKAIYPMVGASAAACAQNLKSNTFTATFTAGWTFASTGVTPNGTSAYINSNLVPNSSLLQNSSHVSAYSRTDSSSGGLFGVYNAGPTNGLYTNPKFGGGTQQSANNSGFGSGIASSNSTGLWINSRISSTEFKIYRNNTTHQTAAITSTGLSTLTIYIGGLNAAGTAEVQNREIAFASIGDGLSDTNASDFYTAVQVFQTTLSRQV